MSSAITVSLRTQGKWPVEVRCTWWHMLCICRTNVKLAAPKLLQ